MDVTTSTEDTRVEERTAEELRDEILQLTVEYHHAKERERRPYRLGRSIIQYGGRVWDETELVNLVDSSLEFWLTAGKWARRLEKALAQYVGVEHCALVNSGSSANLVAFSTLTSPQLGDRRIQRGDEVITVAAGFPTTVTPVIQFGAVPVFVDVLEETVEIDPGMLEAARSDRTRAVFVAHTLGNPFDIDAVKAFCEQHDLWLIEDNCDALGTLYTSEREGRTGRTGSFGHLATCSFYPAHHITMGEGGAVFTDDEQLKLIMESFRDWGRDCYCAPGKENTCGERFAQQHGMLPYGYDHKYVYSHFGYNLKVTDMQAAVGMAQAKKLNRFVQARRDNHAYLRDRLAPWSDVLRPPTATPNSEPSWFGYLMTVADDAPFTRDEIVQAIEQAKIQTRMLFSGNLIKHPCFDEMRATGEGYRVVGELANTDRIMEQAFWIGVFPGLDEPKREYMADTITAFLTERAGSR